MSWNCGTTELVTGGWLSSAYPGLGATGAQIKAATATGAHGAGPLFNDSLLDASEYYWRVHTPPASGTLVPYEIGNFEHTGAADGSWPWTYDIWEDGTKLVGLQPDGSTLVTTLVGVAPDRTATVAGTGTITFTGTGAVSVTVSGGAGVDVTASVAGEGTITFTGTGAVVATVLSAPPLPVDPQVDLDVWGPFILPTVSGCPDETMLHHVRQACIEFCERTGVWAENLTPITSFAGIADYMMSPPAGSAIVKLLSFTMSGRTADFSNQTDGERFRVEQAACDVAWTPNKVTLSVSPTPGATVSTFGVRAALKPSQDATTIGASIFQQYAAQIAAGALSGIYAMVDKPWTNAGASAAMRTLFDSHISKTALKASFGFARGRRRSAIRYF